jgi:hypothetical protein
VIDTRGERTSGEDLYGRREGENLHEDLLLLLVIIFEGRIIFHDEPSVLSHRNLWTADPRDLRVR